MASFIAIAIAVYFSVWGIRNWLHVWFRWLPYYERQQRRAKGFCATCGYDLKGNVSGVCPECGAPVKSEPERPPDSMWLR